MAKREPREGEGRPTHYDDEVLVKSKKYLEVYESLGHAVPSMAGLSLYLGRGRTTLYEWSKQSDKKEFANILDEINATQEQVALSRGLLGDYNSAIVKLLLGKHGYSDKVESNTTVTFEAMSDEELDARIQAFHQ